MGDFIISAEKVRGDVKKSKIQESAVSKACMLRPQGYVSAHRKSKLLQDFLQIKKVSVNEQHV